jgi:hypothetical protein
MTKKIPQRRQRHIQLPLSNEVFVKVDNWRRTQPVMPSRTATIFYLIEKALSLLDEKKK